MSDPITIPAVASLLTAEAILKELKQLDFSSFENPDLVVKALAASALNDVRDTLGTLEAS